MLYRSCKAIFPNILVMKQVAAKFIPKLLNFQQKQQYKNVAE